jgi:uncharacterized protein (TIGR02996 family)
MTRTHADAFLQAILADPDDDAPRLIFADWLEEHGGPAGAARAELIRIQCRLAAVTVPEPLRQQLRVQEAALLREHRREWTRPLRGLAKGQVFQRGFVGEVHAELLRFLAQPHQLFRLAPVQHLVLLRGNASLLDCARAMPVLADCPYLARLHTLDLRNNCLASASVQALLVSEHLGGLQVLNLAFNRMGDSGVRVLARSGLLARLTALDLSNNDIGPAGVRMLAGALERLAAGGDGLRLRSLRLGGNRLGASGLRAVAGCPLLRRVVQLDPITFSHGRPNSRRSSENT